MGFFSALVLALRLAVLMHGFNQNCDVFRRGELRNAVSEVENVSWSGTIGVEYGPGFACDCIGR